MKLGRLFGRLLGFTFPVSLNIANAADGEIWCRAARCADACKSPSSSTLLLLSSDAPRVTIEALRSPKLELLHLTVTCFYVFGVC